jgi:hypothetical protein
MAQPNRICPLHWRIDLKQCHEQKLDDGKKLDVSTRNCVVLCFTMSRHGCFGCGARYQRLDHWTLTADGSYILSLTFSAVSFAVEAAIAGAYVERSLRLHRLGKRWSTRRRHMSALYFIIICCQVLPFCRLMTGGWTPRQKVAVGGAEECSVLHSMSVL